MKEIKTIRGIFSPYLDPDEFFSAVKNPQTIPNDLYEKIETTLNKASSSFFLHKGKICTVSNFNGPAIWEVSHEIWKSDLYIENQDKEYINSLIPAKERTYHILDIKEALNRSEEPEWEKDEWACEVLAYGYKNDLVARESENTYVWTDDGTVAIHNFLFRPLENDAMATYKGTSDFGNYIYEVLEGYGKEKFKAIVVDGVLHSMTRDQEPEAPLKEKYQFKKNDNPSVGEYPKIKLTKDKAIAEMVKGKKISQKDSAIVCSYENGVFYATKEGNKEEMNPNEMSDDVVYTFAKELPKGISSVLENENEIQEKNNLSVKQ